MMWYGFPRNEMWFRAFPGAPFHNVESAFMDGLLPRELRWQSCAGA
jgi:hypothetical protein